MLLLQNLKLNYDASMDVLEKRVRKMLRVPFQSMEILRRSLDARDKSDIKYVYTIRVDTGKTPEEEKRILKQINNKNVMLTDGKEYEFPFAFSPKNETGNAILNTSEKHSENLEYHDDTNEFRPLIIGAGPAGYFAALELARAGFRPILCERGKTVEERTMDVNTFWETGLLLPDSNVSFGEGGAGTFSDGKLFTGNKDRSGRIRHLLKEFVRFGASPEIAYDAKPHIGTDVLVKIMKNMRREIEACGGEILFQTCLIDLLQEETSFESKKYPIYRAISKQKEQKFDIITSSIILAVGNGARDTFRMLHSFGLAMEAKPFAMGLRLEHPQSLIDHNMLGDASPLYPADYKLVHHTEDGRAVFSFCMCPGGYVVNASTEPEMLCVNGMSYSGRDGVNANSAIVVSISPPEQASVFWGMEFQRELEKRFYEAGNGQIPVQRLGDFIKGEKTASLGSVTPQTKGSYTLAELSHCLPNDMVEAIIEAIRSFDRYCPGFWMEDAILSGIEARTSSPIRIIRDESGQSVSHPGIIPAGEGAGYAGGITSSGADGIRAAEAAAEYILGKYQHSVSK